MNKQIRGNDPFESLPISKVQNLEEHSKLYSSLDSQQAQQKKQVAIMVRMYYIGIQYAKQKPNSKWAWTSDCGQQSHITMHMSHRTAETTSNRT